MVLSFLGLGVVVVVVVKTRYLDFAPMLLLFIWTLLMRRKENQNLGCEVPGVPEGGGGKRV